MQPLTSGDITTAFLTKRPFLLLNAPAFDTRYVGSLLAKDAIKSKHGVSLPPEIWLQIFALVALPARKWPKYRLARVLNATSYRGGMKLTCEVVMSALIGQLASLKHEMEVRAINRYLASPDQQHDLFFLDLIGGLYSPTSKLFSITLEDSDNQFLQPCLFQDIEVPEIIAHLQDDVCSVCQDRDGHTICPGCTGGVAEEFGAFMGCGVDLACPLCLGLDFMREDKALLSCYYWDPMPEEEQAARKERFDRRLKELGYLWYALTGIMVISPTNLYQIQLRRKCDTSRSRSWKEKASNGEFFTGMTMKER